MSQRLNLTLPRDRRRVGEVAERLKVVGVDHDRRRLEQEDGAGRDGEDRRVELAELDDVAHGQQQRAEGNGDGRPCATRTSRPASTSACQVGFSS